RFSCSCPLPHLDPLPTRRSSDLSLTPGPALELARVLSEAGLPDGVYNVLTGSGGEVGTALAEHPGVDKVAFTGCSASAVPTSPRSEEHTSELQSRENLVCRLLLE